MTPTALPGGNGIAFDWQALAGLEGRIDYMLAGGLNPANVGEAIRSPARARSMFPQASRAARAKRTPS